MPNAETDSLREELEHFRKEKDKIRKVVGQVGGVTSARRDKAVTISFAVAMVVIFMLDVLRHVMGINVPLPPLFSLEVGVLLVSIKIIWMIHKQTRVEHFQFWILNSIEFRLNDVAKRIKQIEDRLT